LLSITIILIFDVVDGRLEHWLGAIYYHIYSWLFFR
jgi:hypothetical protein